MRGAMGREGSAPLNYAQLEERMTGIKTDSLAVKWCMAAWTALLSPPRLSQLPP